jgi:hypothetical protein
MLIVSQFRHIGGNLALQYFSLSAPVIVASAQSSRVISVSGRRADAEGWRGGNGVKAIVYPD